MKDVRNRLYAVALAGSLSLTALGAIGTPAHALPIPAPVIPQLTFDHTFLSRPWPKDGTANGSGVNANDVEGIGSVAPDHSLWIADDNRDRIYQLAENGSYKGQITAAAFQLAPAVGDLTIAAGTLPDATRTDDFESIVYDPDHDVLYVTSGNCCNAPAGQPPYHPTVYKLTRVAGAFSPTSWQALPEGEDPTAAGWRPGTGMYFGKGSKIKTYDYATNQLGSPISLPVSAAVGIDIVGIDFTDADTAFVTTATPNTAAGRTTLDSTSTIRRFDTATWAEVTNWKFALKGIGGTDPLTTTDDGMIDGRDLAIIGGSQDKFVVTDGYDGDRKSVV